MNLSDRKLIRARLDETRNYIDSLGESIKAFMQDDSHEIIREAYKEGEVATVYFYVKRLVSLHPVQMQFSSIVHHLRSVCDNCIWSIGGAIVQNPKVLGYPCKLSKKEFEKWASGTATGIAPEVIDIIQKSQPFNSYAGEDRLETLDAHPLRVLTEFSNNDKHRTLTITSNFHAMTPVTGIPSEALPYCTMKSSAGKHLDESDFLASISFSNGVIPENIKIQPTAVIVVNSPTTPDRGFIPVEILTHIHDFVRDEIVIPLEPFI